MSTANNIFRSDLSRIRPHEATLLGRPATDQKFLEEANYFLEHGMTRAQAAESRLQIMKDERKARAVDDLQGDPPEFKTRGLTGHRARFARFVAWRHLERKVLADLESTRARFDEMIAAAAATEAEIRKAVRRTAERLLGREQGGESDDGRKGLDDRLSAERHGAEAAREALPELERQIERAKLRVATLENRESEFLNPAIIEVADDMGLGKLYLRKISELREVVDLVFGLSSVVSGWASGFTGMTCHVDGERFPSDARGVNFPHVGFKSIKDDPDQYGITTDGRPDVWANLKQSLILDPYHRAYVPLPKG